MKSLQDVVRIELFRTLHVPAARVWEALTRPAEISKWMKFPARMELRMGGAVHIDFGPEGALEGVICFLDPGHCLAYTWGESIVKWEVGHAGTSTALRLIHNGVKQPHAEGLRDGWDGFLDQLEEFLADPAAAS